LVCAYSRIAGVTWCSVRQKDRFSRQHKAAPSHVYIHSQRPSTAQGVGRSVAGTHLEVAALDVETHAAAAAQLSSDAHGAAVDCPREAEAR